MAEYRRTDEIRIENLPPEQLLRENELTAKRIGKMLGEDLIEREERSQVDSIGQHIEEAQRLLANWGKMQGPSCGYPSIDRMTRGMLPGELVILGGYTSRGKTQLAVNMAYRMATSGIPVLFVTLEMTKAQLTVRFMRLGEIDHETPVFFQALDVLDPKDIDALIERAKGDGCQFVVIDHLHYFARGNNILGQVGQVTRDFKRLAIKHEVPILLLSQLSRPDKSGKQTRLKVPSLSDLKESSYIEQDADLVLMVHRNFPEDDEKDESIDLAEVVVALRKNRPRGMEESRSVAFLRHDMANGVRLFEPNSMFPVKRGM